MNENKAMRGRAFIIATSHSTLKQLSPPPSATAGAAGLRAILTDAEVADLDDADCMSLAWRAWRPHTPAAVDG
jgi:hypothetical protein